VGQHTKGTSVNGEVRSILKFPRLVDNGTSYAAAAELSTAAAAKAPVFIMFAIGLLTVLFLKANLPTPAKPAWVLLSLLICW
jgi:hypothetical protein